MFLSQVQLSVVYRMHYIYLFMGIMEQVCPSINLWRSVRLHRRWNWPIVIGYSAFLHTTLSSQKVDKLFPETHRTRSSASSVTAENPLAQVKDGCPKGVLSHICAFLLLKPFWLVPIPWIMFKHSSGTSNLCWLPMAPKSNYSNQGLPGCSHPFLWPCQLLGVV